MRYLLIALTIALTLSLNASHGEESENTAKPDDHENKAAEMQTTQAKPQETPQAKIETKEWPLPFQPSEKVSADAVISLPTDI